MSAKAKYTIANKQAVKNIIQAGEQLVEQFYPAIYKRVYEEHTRVKGLFFKRPCTFRKWYEKQDPPWNCTVFEFALRENLIDEFEYRIAETNLLLYSVTAVITPVIDASWAGELTVDSTIAEEIHYIEQTVKISKKGQQHVES